ncbi:glycoside hydrolase family 25 protein [Echinicola jeungdonensis]|uniref:Glycoside hydrolase family 25 protein n=1 Tax=Echinicola jeungdonensis TaxID=709343 RepID=A0ABV5J1V2_9BACT|nr:glycoside hydrolase family 25 protein [Echinicola jeungdonensis]MDN3671111.1 glycoside hydrolase family 25 protein [Echinicola jeungdonensis]
MRKHNLYWLTLLLCSILFSCGNTKNDNAQNSKSEIENTLLSHPILGIDVSHFQGTIDWQKIKAANIDFAYDKASQGQGYQDPEYSHNRQGAKNVGLIHGAYHFYVAGENPEKQASNYLEAAEYTPGDMPPVLDLEPGGMKNTVDKKSFQQNVLKWLTLVEEKLKVKPIIYTDPQFGNEYLDLPEFSKYPLWIAEYGVKNPKTPIAWKKNGWLIWQRTDKGKIQGAIGNVDHDLYNPEKNFFK